MFGLFGISDEQAMWRVQMHDDGQAFAQLVARWEAPIRRMCVRMLGDEHKAEDATQEAFTKVYAKRKDYEHGAKFSTFLWRVATNVCLDELRRVKRRGEVSLYRETDEGDETPAWAEPVSAARLPDSEAVAEEDAMLVRQAVNQLPEHYRVVVVLRHYEDLKFREIAEVLGVPEGTVKSRMSEALTILNTHLKRNAEPRAWKRRNEREALVL